MSRRADRGDAEWLMADSIESFVERLQKEGVEAGRAEAAKIVAEARAQAEKVLADAQAQAEKLLAEARSEAEKTLQQGQTELQMAARDVLLKLRETVAAVLERLFVQAAGEALDDGQFLASLLHDVVVEYAKLDAAGQRPLEVRVSEEKVEALTRWALNRLAGGGDKPRVDLKGELQSAGFEYTVSGGTVEVTPESIAEVLSGMVSDRLREMIERAASDEQQ